MDKRAISSTYLGITKNSSVCELAKVRLTVIATDTWFDFIEFFYTCCRAQNLGQVCCGAKPFKNGGRFEYVKNDVS